MNKSGFTLIEALIVIMVTMMMTSILITSSRTSNKQILLFKEQAVFINTISRAKSLAIGTFQPALTTGGSTQPICGWGVHVLGSGSGYILFKDLGTLGPPPSCVGTGTYSADEAFETFTLDPAVHLSGAVPQDASGGLDVVFRPPQPIVFINGATGTFAPPEATIMMGVVGSTNPSTVTITQGGQVSID